MSFIIFSSVHCSTLISSRPQIRHDRGTTIHTAATQQLFRRRPRQDIPRLASATLSVLCPLSLPRQCYRLRPRRFLRDPPPLRQGGPAPCEPKGYSKAV